MKADLEHFPGEFEAGLKDCQRFAFMACGKEFQVGAVAGLAQLAQRADTLKRSAQDREDEDNANALLALQTMALALRSELEMFIALKEERAGEAWDHLVSAQNRARAALRAHSIADPFEPYSERLHAMEEILFPPQLFLSPGIVVGHSECSLCREEYGECGHIAGRAYMGEFCTRVIHEAERVDEISVVEQPADKRRRVFAVANSDGVKRDPLTWREVETGNHGS